MSVNDNPTSPHNLISVKEAANYVGVSEAIVSAWCASGELQHNRPGTEKVSGSIRIGIADLQAFLLGRRSSIGFVYLIEMGGYHKIGSSKNPKKRLRAFEHFPWKATLLHSFPCTDSFAIEMWLHFRFAGQRVRGEWFTLTAQDVTAICSTIFCYTVDDLPAYLLQRVEETGAPEQLGGCNQ